MSTLSRSKSAVPSALGYYHQGLFALVVLCDANDDASVSIETDDDVVLNDTVTKLHQLKHSLGEPPPLSLADVGIWKAIHNWSTRPHDGTEQFVFVTCTKVPGNSELHSLVADTSRTKLLKAMVKEAERVRDERETAKKAGKKKLPHAARADGCEAFLALSTAKKQDALLRHIRIVPESFSALNVPDQIEQKIGGTIMPNIRKAIIERLIQWWDREVVLSLLKKRDRNLRKIELQLMLSKLMLEHSDESLPDDFSALKPTGDDDGGLTRCMQKQIEWVEGGDQRLNRAALARWRARNQRDAWMKGDITMAKALDDYDAILQEAWQDRFGPMTDDCKKLAAEQRIAHGVKLLDWSHLDAPKDVRPIRNKWIGDYLVQGSFQQLADQGKVGWHPDYEALFKALHEEVK